MTPLYLRKSIRSKMYKNKFAKGGATEVPMAVPSTYLYIQLSY